MSDYTSSLKQTEYIIIFYNIEMLILAELAHYL